MLSPGSGPTEIYNYFSFSLEVPRPVWEKKNVCVGGRVGTRGIVRGWILKTKIYFQNLASLSSL